MLLMFLRIWDNSFERSTIGGVGPRVHTRLAAFGMVGCNGRCCICARDVSAIVECSGPAIPFLVFGIESWN
eukprot:12939121-Prorocentrum_lima.AAC.1